MAKMTVYHGGYISVENPQVRIGRNTKDFGTGLQGINFGVWQNSNIRHIRLIFVRKRH